MAHRLLKLIAPMMGTVSKPDAVATTVPQLPTDVQAFKNCILMVADHARRYALSGLSTRFGSHTDVVTDFCADQDHRG